VTAAFVALLGWLAAWTPGGSGPGLAERRDKGREVRRMDAPDVWVAGDDGNRMVRAAAIVGVGIDHNGNITARLGRGDGASVILAGPGQRDGAHPADDFHRQLISIIAQLSDASGAFLVWPAHDQARGWRWVSEPL